MKRWLLLVIIAGMLLFSVSAYGSMHGFYHDYPVAKIMVNGEEIKNSQPALVINDSAMVPIAELSETLDLQVEWDETTYTANIETAKTDTPRIWPVVQSITNPKEKRKFEIIKINGRWDGHVWRIEGQVRNNTLQTAYCDVEIFNIEADGSRKLVRAGLPSPAKLRSGQVGEFDIPLSRSDVEKNHRFEIRPDSST